MPQQPALAHAARLEVRRQARTLARHPQDVGAHLARIDASLRLEGVEPVQGALADLFGTLGAEASGLKAAALQLAAPRLGERLARRFEVLVAAAPLTRVSPLATRWSVAVTPSADVSTRARRCSADDSRAMAAQFLGIDAERRLAPVSAAMAADAEDAQAAFFHHCVTCRDKLAFMLARREWLRRDGALPAAWRAAEQDLLNERSSTCTWL